MKIKVKFGKETHDEVELDTTGSVGDFKAVINNLDDARSALRRTKAFGATSVKSYNQPRREQRQQIMQIKQLT